MPLLLLLALQAPGSSQDIDNAVGAPMTKSGPGSAGERVRRLRHVPLATRFRSTIQFQSTGFGAAGLAAAEVSKGSWSDLVRKRLLDPLDMKATRTSFPDAARSGELATGHRLGEPLP